MPEIVPRKKIVRERERQKCGKFAPLLMVVVVQPSSKTKSSGYFFVSSFVLNQKLYHQ